MINFASSETRERGPGVERGGDERSFSRPEQQPKRNAYRDQKGISPHFMHALYCTSRRHSIDALFIGR